MFTIEFCDKIVFMSFSVHYRVLGAFFNNLHIFMSEMQLQIQIQLQYNYKYNYKDKRDVLNFCIFLQESSPTKSPPNPRDHYPPTLKICDPSLFHQWETKESEPLQLSDNRLNLDYDCTYKELKARLIKFTPRQRHRSSMTCWPASPRTMSYRRSTWPGSDSIV